MKTPHGLLSSLSKAISFCCLTWSSALCAEQSLLDMAKIHFSPLPKVVESTENPLSEDKIALGHMLFFETRLSADGTVSCARCHLPSYYGADALKKSIGAHGREHPFHSPSVLNSALHVASHWRGERANVEAQAIAALVGAPAFANPSLAAAETKLKAIPGYLPLFKKAFPDDQEPVSAANFGKAVGAYERTLQTPGAFDNFLNGDENALSPSAKAGLRTFIEVGCAGCHNGPGVGGNSFQKFGLYKDYWLATGSIKPSSGRFDITGEESDKYVFKVPSLRNVAMTPPYFHDGSVAKLEQAVNTMAELQLGRSLNEQQVSDISAFLQALTGDLPGNFIASPLLPAGPFIE